MTPAQVVSDQITQMGQPPPVQAFGGQQPTYQQLTQALNASALPPLQPDASAPTGMTTDQEDEADTSTDVPPPPTPPAASAGQAPVSAAQAQSSVADIIAQSKKQQEIDQAAIDKIGSEEAGISALDYNFLKSQEQWSPPTPPEQDFNPMQRMAPLLFLAAFGGKLTKLNANAMLGATAGTIDGFLKGDQQKLENSRKQYDEAYQQYMDRRTQQKEIYTAMRQSYKDMIDGDIRALQAAHEMTGDAIAADQKLLDLREHWEQIDATLKERQAAQDSTNWYRRAILKQKLDAEGGSQGQKPPTGYEWKRDPKTGQPALDPNGQRILQPISGGPKDPSAPGGGGGGMFANYAARFPQRVIAASTEGLAQLQTISRLGSSTGVPTQGIFVGSVVGSTKTGTVSQLLTTAQQKMYNAALAGLAPELASAQNQGLAPTEAQITNIIQNLSIFPTDEAQTAQFKVAQLARDFRKALEGGLENMKPEQQARAKQLINQFQMFPDPDVIANAKPGDNMFKPGAFGAEGVQPVQKPKTGVSKDGRPYHLGADGKYHYDQPSQ